MPAEPHSQDKLELHDRPSQPTLTQIRNMVARAQSFQNLARLATEQDLEDWSVEIDAALSHSSASLNDAIEALELMEAARREEVAS